MKLIKRIGLALLVVLVGLQVIPTRSSDQSAEVPSTDFAKTYDVPEKVELMIVNSCYNCHSNNTIYPWYSKIQPVGWFLENHIEKGKEELNLSEFESYSSRKKKSKLKSMISQIENNEMPLGSYTFIHREARLTDVDKRILIDFLNAIEE